MHGMPCICIGKTYLYMDVYGCIWMLRECEIEREMNI